MWFSFVSLWIKSFSMRVHLCESAVCMPYKGVPTFESVDEIQQCDHSNESSVVQYFPVVLFIMLYKVVLTFESVDEILKCDHSNESY